MSKPKDKLSDLWYDFCDIPLDSKIEVMTIYGKEQELAKVEEMTEISESVNNKEERE